MTQSEIDARHFAQLTWHCVLRNQSGLGCYDRKKRVIFKLPPEWSDGVAAMVDGKTYHLYAVVARNAWLFVTVSGVSSLYEYWNVCCDISVCKRFRVSSANDSGRSHVLEANDELDKRHWLQCIDEALSREVSPVTNANLCRHSSDASSVDTMSAEFRSPNTSMDDCPSAAASSADIVSEKTDESCTYNELEMLPPSSPSTPCSLRVSKRTFEEL